MVHVTKRKQDMKINKNCFMFTSQIEISQKANGLYMFSKQGHMFVTGLRKQQLFTPARLKAHVGTHISMHTLLH